jgi:hypothetical protein
MLQVHGQRKQDRQLQASVEEYMGLLGVESAVKRVKVEQLDRRIALLSQGAAAAEPQDGGGASARTGIIDMSKDSDDDDHDPDLQAAITMSLEAPAKADQDGDPTAIELSWDEDADAPQGGAAAQTMIDLVSSDDEDPAPRATGGAAAAAAAVPAAAGAPRWTREGRAIAKQVADAQKAAGSIVYDVVGTLWSNGGRTTLTVVRLKPAATITDVWRSEAGRVFDVLGVAGNLKGAARMSAPGADATLVVPNREITTVTSLSLGELQTDRLWQPFGDHDRAAAAEDRAFIGFYCGSNTQYVSRNGAPASAPITLEEVMRYDAGELESKHNFIQWLFPLKTSGTNVDCPRVGDAELRAIVKSYAVGVTIVRCYECMLRFYGFRMVDDRGQLVHSFDHAERVTNLLLNPHNNLRISRMLRSMCLMGFEAYAVHFLDAMLAVSQQAGAESLLKKSTTYWAASVHGDEKDPKPAGGYPVAAYLSATLKDRVDLLNKLGATIVKLQGKEMMEEVVRYKDDSNTQTWTVQPLLTGSGFAQKGSASRAVLLRKVLAVVGNRALRARPRKNFKRTYVLVCDTDEDAEALAIAMGAFYLYQKNKGRMSFGPPVYLAYGVTRLKFVVEHIVVMAGKYVAMTMVEQRDSIKMERTAALLAVIDTLVDREMVVKHPDGKSYEFTATWHRNAESFAMWTDSIVTIFR